jgi:hypothetical protein
MSRDIFEELIQTVERSSKNNKLTILNVELFAKSWRKEMELVENIDALGGVVDSTAKWLVEFRNTDESVAYVVYMAKDEDDAAYQFIDDFIGLEWIEITEIKYNLTSSQTY